jgi:hypothetical protein
VELLVVIGIIAVLAAIIFPIYARSRRKAYETACISNLHQLALAWNQYYDDHEGGAPSLVCLMPYVGSESLFLCPMDHTEWGWWGERVRVIAVNDGVDPDAAIPFPLTYAYDPRWAASTSRARIARGLENHPDAGLIGCPCHGERLMEGQVPGDSYTGLALRARLDGSVVRGRYTNESPSNVDPALVLYGNEGRPW